MMNCPVVGTGSSYGNFKNAVSFGRAYTTAEKEQLKNVLQEAYDELDIKHRGLILPSAACPPNSKEENTGIGSIVSKGGQKAIKFFNEIFGFNVIQTTPLGEYTPLTGYSPYSTENFSLGTHLLDPSLLKDLGLASEEDLKIIYIKPENVVDKFKDDYQEHAKNIGPFLDKVYKNFKNLDDDHPVKQSFEAFKQNSLTKKWLRSDALFDVLANKYKTQDIQKWDPIDKDLMKILDNPKDSRYPQAVERKLHLEKVYKPEIEKYEMTQFLIHDQLDRLLKKAKKKDINIISDLLIGFSNKDYWRKQDAFLGPYSTYGCKAHDGRLNDWGIKALNFYNSKAAEELLQEKVEKTLMHGIRLDAVWQYFEPVIKHNYPDNKDFEIVPADKVNDKFIRVIENVINEHGIPKELIISENLSPSGNVYSKLKNIGFPQLSVAHFNESIQDSPADNWQALSTLDTPSINTFTNGNKYKQKILWSRLFYGPVNWERGPNKILTTVFDVLGMNETYNKADSQDCSNWKMRLPEDFDAFYFKQVKNDNALNLPEILKTSLEWKNKGSQALKNKLQMFADILKEDGPMTEKEANEFFAKTAEEEASGILKKVS